MTEHDSVGSGTLCWRGSRGIGRVKRTLLPFDACSSTRGLFVFTVYSPSNFPSVSIMHEFGESMRIGGAEVANGNLEIKTTQLLCVVSVMVGWNRQLCIFGKGFCEGTKREK